MEITVQQMNEAMEHGYIVKVVVNGEYYDFAPEGTKEVEKYFTECRNFWIRQGLPMSQAMARAIWFDCCEVWNFGKSWTPAKVAFINRYRRYKPYDPIPEKEQIEKGNA